MSVDGGCDRGRSSVKDGMIGATSQQYPLKMATLGMEAIAKIARGGEKPTGHAGPRLLQHRRRAGDRQAGRGRGQHHVAEGAKICWG